MPFSSMLRHPVGKLTTAARWYLAMMGILGLVLAAAHFSMQVQAQHEAKKLVVSWLQESNSSIGDVRYRMLRGALTLLDVQFKQPGMDVRISSVELHGYLASLSGKQPRLETLRMHDVSLQINDSALWNSALQQGWQMLHDDGVVVGKLWRAAKHVQLSNMVLHWISAEQVSTSILLNHAQLKQVEAGRREMRASIQLFDGNMHLSAIETENKLKSGHMTWRQLDGKQLLTAMPQVNAVEGLLSGRMAWSYIDDKWSFDAEAKIKRENISHVSTLNIDGDMMAEKWQAEIQSRAWPMAMFSQYLPQPGGLQVVTGTIDGIATFKGDATRWRMRLDTAELHHLHVQSNTDSHLWQLGQISLKEMDMTWPGKTLALNYLQLSEGELPMMLSASAMDWRGHIRKIALQHMEPFVLADGREVLRLPAMKGHANWNSSQGFDVNIRSHEKDAVSGEFWRVSGNFNDQLNIKFNDAPASRFRAWLPAILREGADILVGKVSSKLIWEKGEQGWQLSGRMHIADADIQMGSERLLLKAGRIDIGKAGPNLAEQQIDNIDIQGWHYQAALKPLSVMASEIAQPSEPLLQQGWRINALLMQGGRLSAGAEDAVWMKDVDLNIKTLRKGSSARVSVRGLLNGGSFSLNGHFDPFSPGFQPENIAINVRDALPFFAGDWLELSGMPRLTRGRLYLDMSIKSAQQGGYQGKMYLRLQQGALAEGVYLDDPLLMYAGYQSHDLFSRLNQDGRIRLRLPINADVLTWQVLGQALLQGLQQDVAQKSALLTAVTTEENILFQLRVHQAKGLSYNERIRLRKAMIKLKENPTWVIELQPQLGAQPLDQSMISQVRYTQSLLTSFMVGRGISRSRIFPVWPQAHHRSNSDSSSIQLIARP